MGRFWGRDRFSERSASPPAPLSRRASGDWVGWLFGVGSACELGVSPIIDWAMVTAADRAAATCQHGRTKAPAFPATRMRKQSICRSPHPASPRRLCQPPWTHTSLSETPLPTGGTKQEEPYPAERQPLFGREGSGGRGASLREAASPPSVPPPTVVLREGARGRGLLAKKPPPSQSSPDFPHNLPRLLPLAMPLFAWYHRVDGICAAEGA